MAGIRLVATDLDGTLLRDTPPISPRVVTALQAVQATGVVIVLVTARNWRGVLDIAEEAGVRGLAICSNGAVVYDLEALEVRSAHPIDIETAREFFAACRASVAGVCFGWETALGAYRDPTFHELAPALSAAYNAAVELFDAIEDGHAATKVLVRHPDLEGDELLARIAPIAAERLVATISGGPFVEISAAGITKAHTLELLCAELGIARYEVVAIGDQPNDIPMLQWAGRGVAMGNSHPAVLAAVHEHTASNLDDGVALVLESLL
jgi:Cof subfamily protein (haloacid dehalogenase superfamily)